MNDFFDNASTGPIEGDRFGSAAKDYAKQRTGFPEANFDELQNLQSEIRSFVFNHEPISTLKAFISLRDGNPDWNRLLPPLCILQNEQTNKSMIKLKELVNKMNFLLSDF